MELKDFEIGKTYTNSNAGSVKFKCLVKNSLGYPVVEHLNGTFVGTCFQISPKATLRQWSEFREPVVHKRILFWLKDTDGKVITTQVDPNDGLTLKYWRKSHINYTVLSEEEISYTEK